MTWRSRFTATLSGVGLALLLLAVPVTSQVRQVRGPGAGGAFSGQMLAPDGTQTAPSYSFITTPSAGLYVGGLNLAASGSAADVLLVRDVANTLAQRNGTNAQIFNLYRTFTDASNYIRLSTEGDFGGSGIGVVLRGAGTGAAGTPFYLGTETDTDLAIRTNGIGRWNFQAAGNFVSNGNYALGYSTGAGGTVTQITNKSTGVTLNKVTGLITMNAAALAADTTVSFTLTDSTIAANDMVLCAQESGGTASAYHCTAVAAAGSATMRVRNVTPGSLSEAVVLKFMVFKSIIS